MFCAEKVSAKEACLEGFKGNTERQALLKITAKRKEIVIPR